MPLGKRGFPAGARLRPWGRDIGGTIAEHAAKSRDISLEELATATTANARKLFGI